MSDGLYSGVSGLAIGIGLYKGVSGLWSGASGLLADWDSPFAGASLYLNMLSGSLDSRVTFTRTTTATFTGSNGLIQTAAINGPRFDYDPVTLAPRGLLIEEQRTNLVLRSEQFDDAYWTKLAATVTANNTSSPDGTTNADFVLPDAISNVHAVFPPTLTVTANTPHTLTVYAKAGGYNFVALAIHNGGITAGNEVIQMFNLSNGTVGNSYNTAPTSASITSMGNGWYRCQITWPVVTTSLNSTIFLNSTDANPRTSWTGDGTSGIFIYGAQLEAGAFATSYIPTVASQVTRSADVATMTGTNFSSWYNTTQGTIFVSFTGAPAQARVWATTTTGGQTISDNDGGGNNARTSMFNVAYTDTGGTPTTTGLQYKIAYGYKQSDYASSTNGGAVQTSATTAAPTVQSFVSFGSLGSSEFLNGHIRQIAYYNTRLPNDQLQALTT